MFTQKCFIRKNTPEIVKRLEELGYKASFSARNGYGEYLYAFNGAIVGGEYNAYNEKAGFIDCVTNEELFLAIAALRDDSDIHQWFIHDDSDWHNDQNIFWHKCESESIKIDMAFNIMYSDCRKATVEELIEHFKP